MMHGGVGRDVTTSNACWSGETAREVVHDPARRENGRRFECQKPGHSLILPSEHSCGGLPAARCGTWKRGSIWGVIHWTWAAASEAAAATTSAAAEATTTTAPTSAAATLLGTPDRIDALLWKGKGFRGSIFYCF